MIDLHFHCLPGVDDGPQTWEEAVALCRHAATEGTTTIIATPHVLREEWVNEHAEARDELISKLNTILEEHPPSWRDASTTSFFWTRSSW